MRRLNSLVLVAVLFASAPVFARMYQWIEGSSGVVRLSGDPPPWYRNGREGPRTLVFENGRLVDDTAIPLPREQEETLRTAAFQKIDLKREEGAVKKLERAALREAMSRDEVVAAVPENPETAKPEAPASEEQKDPVVAAGDLDAKTVEQMKGLIQEWDKQRGGAARSP